MDFTAEAGQRYGDIALFTDLFSGEVVHVNVTLDLQGWKIWAVKLSYTLKKLVKMMISFK